MNKLSTIYIVSLALFVLLLVGCTKDEAGTIERQVPIEFVAKSPTFFISRGAIESDAALQTAGFGVFAYYTGTYEWALCDGSATEGHTSKVAPNFMYNQQVTWSTDHWTYSPVKYWPNDNNPADDSGATGSQTHSYVSFFAYTPYTTTGLSSNSTAGAPTINYTWAADNDLLYATQLDRYKYDSSDANDNGRVGDAVSFTFKHALAKVYFKIRRKANTDPNVVVKSLSISGYNTVGTFDLGAQTWTTQSTPGSPLILISSNRTLSDENVIELDNSLFIPTSGLTFSTEYTCRGNTFRQNNSNMSITLQEGYKYTVIFTIDGDAIVVDIERFTEQW